LIDLSANRLLLPIRSNSTIRLMVISYLARLQLLSRLGLLAYIHQILKVGDTLDHTLFVGIDVSKHSNFVYAMNLNSEKLLTSCVPNTQDGANQIESKLLKLLEQHGLTKVIVVLESTGVYSAHVATYLSASKALSVFDIRVYIINPKISRNYRKSFADMDKTDPRDAFVLADLARVGNVLQDIVFILLSYYQQRRFMPLITCF